ncbi:MAG TPA: lactate utilization protein [Symbiobacteriaceae bacterium]
MTDFAIFQSALVAVGGAAIHVPGPAEAGAAVLAALRERGVTEAIAWADPLLAQTGLPAAARAASITWLTADPAVDPAEIRAVAARAGAGITGADLAVAETGTLALLSGPGRPRSVNLLPPLHVAVLPLERLLAATPDLFRELSRLAQAGRLRGALHLVTGPSRSADIEDVVIRKMHGPGELLVVLVERL